MTERSTTHTRQRSKNRFFLAVLLLVVAGFFYLSILKTTEARLKSHEGASAPLASDAR